ncbi:MAG: methyltransferase family protein [Candidatus Aminicenantales bacterium]
MNKSSFRKIAYRGRVRFALFVLIVVLVLARPTFRSVVIGAAIGLIGLALRAWAAGHIRKEKALAVTGPYRYTRNPLYLGSFILGLGLVVGARSWWGAGVFVVYFLAFYIPVMAEERDRLRNLFPRAESEYESRVPAFFPTLRPAPATEPRKWDSALFLRNKEYRAWIGTTIVWGLFILRGLIR